jgi:Tfp pilus assembly protein PilV
MTINGFLSIFRLRKTKPISSKGDGFTLVEIMVAAVLASLSVIAVVSVVNTGSMMEKSDNDRRAARAVVKGVFEQQYDNRDYNMIPLSDTLTDSVVIDERAGNLLKGFLRTFIAPDTVTNGTVSVPGKMVSITCSWVEVKGPGDSVCLTKIIAKAQ